MPCNCRNCCGCCNCKNNRGSNNGRRNNSLVFGSASNPNNTNFCPSPCDTVANIDTLRRTCPNSGIDCTPIFPSREEVLAQREYVVCTDQDGCFASYPAECRDRFWPSFAHPRWLCCSDLYCNCQ